MKPKTIPKRVAFADWIMLHRISIRRDKFCDDNTPEERRAACGICNTVVGWTGKSNSVGNLIICDFCVSYEKLESYKLEYQRLLSKDTMVLQNATTL